MKVQEQRLRLLHVRLRQTVGRRFPCLGCRVEQWRPHRRLGLVGPLRWSCYRPRLAKVFCDEQKSRGGTNLAVANAMEMMVAKRILEEGLSKFYLCGW